MGYDHCAWVADDGSLWTSGANDYGELGLGDDTSRNRPSRLPNLPPISSVQSGCYATLCLDTSGNLWSFGNNDEGQLGLGDTVDRSSPKMVPSIPPVLSFCFQHCHTIILCEDGSIWSFGYNGNGQLGLGHQKDQSAPVQLPSSCFPTDITSVQCGLSHSFFLTSEGQVLSCGKNGKGQLGQGDSTDRSTPTLIANMNDCIQIVCGGNMSCMVDSSYRLWVCGSHTGCRQEIPLWFPSVGLIQIISIGYRHTLCVNQSGELWGWGKPSSGELGNESTRVFDPFLIEKNMNSCLCLGYSSFIRNAFSYDFCSGKNSTGQLGLGNTTNQYYFRVFEFWEEKGGEKEEKFRMRFPQAPLRKFSQKSARSALPLPE